MPSLTPPSYHIIPPWCLCSANAAQQPIRRGGCQADGSYASGRHRQLAGTLPRIFLRRTQTTRTPQRPSTRCDLNGQQRSPWPWCPAPGAATQSMTISLVDISVRWLQYFVSKIECMVLNSLKGFWRSLPQRSHSFLNPNLKTRLPTHWYPFPLHSQGLMPCKQQSDILTVYQSQFFA